MTTSSEFEEGWQAFIEDKIIKECPYLHNTPNYLCWMEGWKTGFNSHMEFYGNKSDIKNVIH